MTNIKEEWTKEALQAIQLCKDWAIEVRSDTPSDIYLFGSAVYQGGDQFDPQMSDLDLVIVFHEELDATERVVRLVNLRNLKARLELDLVPRLQRTNCVDPGTSVIPITQLELITNIHKSGARRFFDKNFFFNLTSETLVLSLPSAGSGTLSDEVRQALEYAQKVRNQFLGVGANLTTGLAAYNGADPIPKELARVAAQLVPDADEGEWYDTRHGLEHIFQELTRRRGESIKLNRLHKKISIRRGGRGQRKPLSDDDLLLLAELLYDLAANVRPEPVVVWEIRFSSSTLRDSDRELILSELRRLVPDADILGVFGGSIVVRIRSSMRSYDTVRRLHSLKVLSSFFKVEDVEISEPGVVGELSKFHGPDAVAKIAEHIAQWRPHPSNMRMMENDLAEWLFSWIDQNQELQKMHIARDVRIVDTMSHIRADFVIDVFRPDGSPVRVIIDLVSFRQRSYFLRELQLLLGLNLACILVVIGSNEQLSGVRDDIQKFGKLNAQVKIVTIAFDRDKEV